MKCHDEFPYEAHIFYFYELLCFYILIGACIARHKMGSCKWLLAGRVSGWGHGRGIGRLAKEGGWGDRGGEGWEGVGGALTIQWAATLSTFLVLRVHPNAVVCDIYVVKLPFRDTLPQRSFENSSRMKNVRLRIDKVLRKIGSSPYLVKKLHTQFRPQSTARRTDIS